MIRARARSAGITVNLAAIWSGKSAAGHFGCRDAAGGFDADRFSEQAAATQVKMIEVKLSQGAKPGHGGVLPGAKVTPEIASARGVAPGVDCVSLSGACRGLGPNGTARIRRSSALRRRAASRPDSSFASATWELFFAIAKADACNRYYSGFHRNRRVRGSERVRRQRILVSRWRSDAGGGVLVDKTSLELEYAIECGSEAGGKIIMHSTLHGFGNRRRRWNSARGFTSHSPLAGATRRHRVTADRESRHLGTRYASARWSCRTRPSASPTFTATPSGRSGNCSPQLACRIPGNWDCTISSIASRRPRSGCYRRCCRRCSRLIYWATHRPAPPSRVRAVVEQSSGERFRVARNRLTERVGSETARHRRPSEICTQSANYLRTTRSWPSVVTTVTVAPTSMRGSRSCTTLIFLPSAVSTVISVIHLVNINVGSVRVKPPTVTACGTSDVLAAWTSRVAETMPETSARAEPQRQSIAAIAQRKRIFMIWLLQGWKTKVRKKDPDLRCCVVQHRSHFTDVIPIPSEALSLLTLYAHARIEIPAPRHTSTPQFPGSDIGCRPSGRSPTHGLVSAGRRGVNCIPFS